MKKIIFVFIIVALIASIFVYAEPAINAQASYSKPSSAYGEWGVIGGKENRLYMNRKKAKKFANELTEYNPKKDRNSVLTGILLGFIPQTKGTIGIAYSLNLYMKNKENYNFSKRIKKVLKNKKAKGVYIDTIDGQGRHYVTVKKWNGKRSSIKSPSNPPRLYSIKKMKIYK